MELDENSTISLPRLLSPESLAEIAGNQALASELLSAGKSELERSRTLMQILARLQTWAAPGSHAHDEG